MQFSFARAPAAVTLIAGLVVGLVVASTVPGFRLTAASGGKKTMLIHVSSDPFKDESKAALSFLIGKFAYMEGYEQVNIFLAGDAVYLLQDKTLNSLVGKGTGVLKESYDAVIDAGGTFYVSGMSCKSRGIAPEEFAEKNPGGTPVTFEMPSKLIALVEAADTVFYY
jgi:predicted peroxiredoxin